VLFFPIQKNNSTSMGHNMRLSRALTEKLMDVRLRDKFLTEGKLSKEEVKIFLDSISDEQKNSSFTNDQSEDEE
jgi:polyhydroxyalkanoate synthesis regulator phasin